MKVYLVGYLYDDYTTKIGFHVTNITSTIDRARILLRFLKKKYPNEQGYEIREWAVDVVDPVGEILHKQCGYGGLYFDKDEVMPYKVIKEEEDKNA